GKPGFLDGPGEGCVLGEKPVAGMDRLRPGALRRVEDALDREVALRRRRRPQEERLVGVGDVERAAISLRVNADRTEPELAERTGDRDCDAPSVGDEYLLEHRRAVFSTPWTSHRPTSSRSRASPLSR